MATSFNNLVDSLAEKLGQSNNYAFKEMLKLDIISARATLIKREYEKSKLYNESLVQTIKCVPMISVSGSECNTITGFGKVIRSKNKIPKPLLVKDNTTFLSITTPFVNNKRRSITILKPEEVEFIEYRRFTVNDAFATYENEHIYLHNVTNLFNISVRGLFENPYSVKDYVNQSVDEKTCPCNCEDCGDCSSSLDANCNQEQKDNCFGSDSDITLENSLIDGIASLILSKQIGNNSNNSEIKINE
jgi:hypothetical protein